MTTAEIKQELPTLPAQVQPGAAFTTQTLLQLIWRTELSLLTPTLRTTTTKPQAI